METTEKEHGTVEEKRNKLLMDYPLLAQLFVYPENEDYKNRIAEVYTYLQKTLPEAAEALEPFADYVRSASTVEVQELFLRSFDVQAITTLDIGFVLFGEDYKRGKLLAHLNEEHNKAGNDCATELSDHLPNLLRLLPKIADKEIQAEVATLLLYPAAVKMLQEFSPGKIEKKDEVYKKHQKVLLAFSASHRTMYQHTLQALALALENDFREEMAASQASETEWCDPANPVSNAGSASDKDFSAHIETEILTDK